MPIPTLDRLPDTWLVLDVMRRKARSQAWTALVVNVHPHDCPPGALRQGWLPVPGRHASKDAAWGALRDAIATHGGTLSFEASRLPIARQGGGPGAAVRISLPRGDAQPRPRSAPPP